jgi:hypothetical protein
VESAESKEIVPQVVSSSNADYYIAKDFTEYRQHFTQHLDSGRLLQCAQAAAQEAYPQVDFMYAMPGLFHNGHPLPQAASLSRQWLLSLSRPWSAAIHAPKPISAVDSTSISTSSSYSSSDGNGGKGTGTGAGAPGQRSSKRQRTLCRH